MFQFVMIVYQQSTRRVTSKSLLALLLFCLLTACAQEKSSIPPGPGQGQQPAGQDAQGRKSAEKRVDYVVVKKSEKKMYLLSHNIKVKEYHIALGGNPFGHKRQEGDQRTPEGKYFLDYKKADSAYYKSIHISYPNENDKAAAAKAGVKPGGQIMIHGQKNDPDWLASVAQQFNWTAGCIAVTNPEMSEIWDLVAVGTPIEILP